MMRWIEQMPLMKQRLRGWPAATQEGAADYEKRALNKASWKAGQEKHAKGYEWRGFCEEKAVEERRRCWQGRSLAASSLSYAPHID